MILTIKQPRKGKTMEIPQKKKKGLIVRRKG